MQARKSNQNEVLNIESQQTCISGSLEPPPDAAEDGRLLSCRSEDVKDRPFIMGVGGWGAERFVVAISPFIRIPLVGTGVS